MKKYLHTSLPERASGCISVSKSFIDAGIPRQQVLSKISLISSR